MRRKKTTALSAQTVFAVANTNEFLVALENWIARKLPAAPEMPAADFQKLMHDLDRIERSTQGRGADPALAFGQLAQALNTHLPAAFQTDPPSEDLFSHPEKLFRAVYYFDSTTYNDGVESYLEATDERGFARTLEGLQAIGAAELRAKLADLRAVVFGRSYPKTEAGRRRRCEEPQPKAAQALAEFGRAYAQHRPQLDELLARWARDNKGWFSE